MVDPELNDDSSILTIDLDKLFFPISIEQTAGDSLRYEGTYDSIRKARHKDDNLDQGIYQRERKHPDWRLVNEICVDALETKTKDIQIGVWLMEAWIHLYGFAGLREGGRLIAELCEGFWENLYPELEDENIERRVGPIHWINEKLPLSLKLVPVTAPDTSDAKAYTWSDWDSACRLDNLAKRDSSLLKTAEFEGKVTHAQMLGSVMLTPLSYFNSLDEELSRCRDSVLNLERVLYDKCGNNAPGLLPVKETVDKVQRFVRDILKERGAEEIHADLNTNNDTEQIASDDLMLDDNGEKPVWSGGNIRNRTEAYRRLSEVADYLLRTEPHSPTPYLVKRAVAWGSMSLNELLQEIVRNKGEMDELNQLLRLINRDETQ